MTLSKLSPARLQPQVTVVALLGELLATLPSRDEEMLLFMSSVSLYEQLEGFSTELRAANRCIRSLRQKRRSGSEPIRLLRLSEALAAWESTPWITWEYLKKPASEWQGWVDKCVASWAQLAWAATELHNACREEATKAADIATAAMARARALQDEAARDGTAQGNMVGLGLALGGEEGTRVVARREARLRRQARVAASEATRATMVREQLEEALGLLERLVAACDEATAFPRELQRRVGDIRAAMKGTNEASRDVPEDLLTKVAVAERLWEANARLAKDHLRAALDDIKDMFSCDSSSSRARGVTEKCQKAIEDIPNLLHGGVIAVMSLRQ